MSIANKSLPVLFVLTLVFACMIFWQALNGPFLLDDYVHLPRISENGTIDSARKVYEFMFGGGGATGRPLSFLSMLINDNAWPSDPWGFKYTNLLIHLLNGVLVFVFIRQLTTLFSGREQSEKNEYIPLVVMAIWLLHPIQLSPMMLTIQRMTLLMALFTLLGLIAFLKGRVMSAHNPVKGYITMSLGVALFGIIGALCKETAVMMICYIFALEFVLFKSIGLQPPPFYKHWFFTFVILPFLSIWAYFIYAIGYMDELYVKRDFNMAERLMTESRVLIDYIKIILMPSISASGPFHDDYVISRSLFEPSTFASIFAIVSGLVFALFKRKQFPLLSFSIFWFLLAHSLESTILPLELYFEHRNYLPMLGPIFAFVFWLTSIKGKIKPLVPFFIIAFIGLEAGISYASSKVWGNNTLIATIWAHEHPASMRAQLGAIRFWFSVGNIEKVKEHFDIAHAHAPDDAGMYLYKYLLDKCKYHDNGELKTDIETLRKIIPSASFEHASLESIKHLVTKTRQGKCTTGFDEIIEIINLYLTNKKFYNVSSARGTLYQQKSMIYIEQGDLDNTIKMLDLAYQAVPKYGFALNQAYLLYTAGLYNEAMEYIEIAKKTKAHNTGVKLWKAEHIAEVEKAIRMEMDKSRETSK